MDQHIFPIMSEEFLGPLLEELLENPLMGVNITDGQGRVLFLNRTHKHITGRYAGYIRYFSKMNGYYNSDMEDYIRTKLIESLFKFRLDR